MSLIGTDVSDWAVLSKVDTSFLMTVNMMAICEGVTSSGIRNDYALFVTHNGDMYAVGSSTQGCLGLGDVTETQVPVQIKDISEVSGISSSGTYGDVLVCTREGKLYAWGRNIKEKPCKIPTLIEALKSVIVSDVACCRGHYLALSSEGEVFEWRGVNTWSVLSKTPTLNPLDAVVVAIACGASHSLALTQNGDVYFWGVNWNSDGTRITQSTPVVMDLHDERIIKVACGGDHSMALTESGNVITWGCNGYGQLGTGNTTNSPNPIKITVDCGRFVDIATNGNVTSAAVTEAGRVYMWGKGENDVKVLIPTATEEQKEMHQVFAKCSRSSFVWTCKTCGEVSLVIEECPYISKEEQASFNNEEQSDLTLIVESKPIHVHRYILSQRSQYFFHSMLQQFWTSDNQREIELNAFEYDVYLSYLWFLYTGVLKTSSDNLLGLWDLANAYGEESLKLGCETLLKKNLSMEKVAMMYSRAMTKKSNECIMWKKKHAKLQEELENMKAAFQQFGMSTTLLQSQPEAETQIRIQQQINKDADSTKLQTLLPQQNQILDDLQEQIPNQLLKISPEQQQLEQVLELEGQQEESYQEQQICNQEQGDEEEEMAKDQEHEIPKEQQTEIPKKQKHKIKIPHLLIPIPPRYLKKYKSKNNKISNKKDCTQNCNQQQINKYVNITTLQPLFPQQNQIPDFLQEEISDQLLKIPPEQQQLEQVPKLENQQQETNQEQQHICNKELDDQQQEIPIETQQEIQKEQQKEIKISCLLQQIPPHYLKKHNMKNNKISNMKHHEKHFNQHQIKQSRKYRYHKDRNKNTSVRKTKIFIIICKKLLGDK